MKTLLLPTDFSGSSENALKNGLSLLQYSGEPIRVLLLNTFLIPPARTCQTVPIHDEMKNNSLRLLEREANALKQNPAYKNLSFETLTYMGSLDNVVAYLTQERNIDCVIMLADRDSKNENFARFSIRSSCPILVVPA